MSLPAYVVVGSEPWNRCLFDSTLRSLPGQWKFIGELDELTVETFVQRGGFRCEFSRAAVYDGRIVTDVTITPVEGPSGNTDL